MPIEIILAKPDHLDEIYRIWGLNRATLGLMPRDAFKDCIKKKWIIIALVDEHIAGYLQFRHTARTQTLAIVHLCVDKTFRGQGYSEKLLDKLVSEFKDKARGIKLNCRSDYDKAISFWTRYNFQPKGKLPSRGNNPNVHLVTWWFSFGRLDLFSFIETDKIKAVLDFNIIAKLMDLDSSDVSRDEIIQLQSDWLATEVEYHRTSETLSEIHRDKDETRHERSRSFIKDIPELNIDKPSIKLREQELCTLFPGNSENDRSDRRQIAEAILSGFPYFITLDEGIIRNSDDIFNKYQLKIVKPSTLISEIDLALNAGDYYPNRLSANNFFVGKLRPDERNGLDTIFLNTGVGEKKVNFNNSINELISKPTGCVQVVKEGDEIVGLFGYYESEEFFYVRMLRTKQYSLRQTIFMQNVNDLIKIALQKRKTFIVINDKCLTPLEIDILKNYGFFERKSEYIRGISDGLFFSQNLKTSLQKITTEIPNLDNLVSDIESSTVTESYLSTVSLEKLLWPLKVIDAEIPCFIIPIKPFYAKELFDTKAAKAELFGVQPKLIWNKENVYYRNVQPNVEEFPARILWYVSEDRTSPRQKAIVCASYLEEVITGPAKELFKKHEKFGIYSWQKDIMPLVKNIPEKEIKILKFSNSEAFNISISLKTVKRILALNGESDNNFQSPLRIKTSTFMKLYALGKELAFVHE